MSRINSLDGGIQGNSVQAEQESKPKRPESGKRRRPLPTAAPLVPRRPTLGKLREAGRTCRACPLWKKGKQTVFGAGPSKARVVLVGEQPGYEEDIVGKPFVGPAGKLLDKALVSAGIDRSTVYLTNVVKHFKWEPKGNQHMHKKPNAAEVSACFPWLEAELAVLKPAVVVCLGATAAQAFLGKAFRVTRQRGQLLPRPGGGQIIATVHPSSILRAPDSETRHRAMERFIEDLGKVTKADGLQPA